MICEPDLSEIFKERMVIEGPDTTESILATPAAKRQKKEEDGGIGGTADASAAGGDPGLATQDGRICREDSVEQPSIETAPMSPPKPEPSPVLLEEPGGDDTALVDRAAAALAPPPPPRPPQAQTGEPKKETAEEEKARLRNARRREKRREKKIQKEQEALYAAQNLGAPPPSAAAAAATATEKRAKKKHKKHKKHETLVEGRTARTIKKNITMDDVDGLPDDMAECWELWKALDSEDSGRIFAEPVDPVKLNIPTYRQIIKRPMDMSTILEHMFNELYDGPEDFAADMRLMYENALKFNPPGTEVHAIAARLSNRFEEKFARISGIPASPPRPVPAIIPFPAATLPPPAEPLRPHGQHGHRRHKHGHKRSRSRSKSRSRSRSRSKSRSRSRSRSRSKSRSRSRSRSKGHSKFEPKSDFLEKQLLEMSQKVKLLESQLKTVKTKAAQTAVAPAPKKSPAAKTARAQPTPKQPRQTRQVPDGPRPMTLDEKKRLSANINKMPPDKMSAIVDLIQTRLPGLMLARPGVKRARMTEIEIDLDALDSTTLRDVERFVKQALALAAQRRRRREQRLLLLQSRAKQQELAVQSTDDPAEQARRRQSSEDVQRQIQELESQIRAVPGPLSAARGGRGSMSYKMPDVMGMGMKLDTSPEFGLDATPSPGFPLSVPPGAPAVGGTGAPGVPMSMPMPMPTAAVPGAPAVAAAVATAMEEEEEESSSSGSGSSSDSDSDSDDLGATAPPAPQPFSGNGQPFILPPSYATSGARALTPGAQVSALPKPDTVMGSQGVVLKPEAKATWNKLAFEAVETEAGMVAGEGAGAGVSSSTSPEDAWSEFRTLGEHQKERDQLRAAEEERKRAEQEAAERQRRAEEQRVRETQEREARERQEREARDRQAEQERINAERIAARQRLAQVEARTEDEDDDLIRTFESGGGMGRFNPDEIDDLRKPGAAPAHSTTSEPVQKEEGEL